MGSGHIGMLAIRAAMTRPVMFGPDSVAPAGNPMIHFDFPRRNPAADPARFRIAPIQVTRGAMDTKT